jgi:drug/metabolite transporter superfamily protein YnfA
MSGTFHTLEWARSAADTVFLVVGVVPLVVAVAILLLGSRGRGRVAS